MASLIPARNAQAHEPIAGGRDLGLEDGGVGVIVVLAGEGEVGGGAGRDPGNIEGVKSVVGEVLIVIRRGDDGIEPCYVSVGRWVYGEDQGEKGEEDEQEEDFWLVRERFSGHDGVCYVMVDDIWGRER